MALVFPPDNTLLPSTQPQVTNFLTITGLYSLAMVILPELAPPGYQKYVGAMIGMVIASSGVLGPVLGGILTHYTTWRWIFWIKYVFGMASRYSLVY